MTRLNLVAWDNGGGLSRDLDLLAGALGAAGWQVACDGRPVRDRVRRHPLRRALGLAARSWVGRLAGDPGWDVNLFLEQVVPPVLARAGRNLLIPNPEWFGPLQRRLLPRVDRVLCKTRHAVALFEGLGCEPAYLGFTSADRRLPRAGPPAEGCFHMAAGSREKGTAALVALWRRHPEWPRLTIAQHPRLYGGGRADPIDLPNVRHVLEYLGDDDLRRLQNAHDLHLCPSEVEGFGHCIVEAMSCGAVVLTTDAPPMNELVGPDRGVLVRCAGGRPQRLGTRYPADPADLERQVARLLGMDGGQRARLGAAARRWFEDNDGRFRAALAAALAQVR